MSAPQRRGEHLRHFSSGCRTFQSTKTLFFFLQERTDASHTTDGNCYLDRFFFFFFYERPKGSSAKMNKKVKVANI